MTSPTVRACARLSRWPPARILCCSESAGALHASVGYAADKVVFVPNGFAPETFRPDLAARGVVKEHRVVGPLRIRRGAPRGMDIRCWV